MYAITHNGKAYGPNGLITDTEGTPLLAEHTADYNRQLEEQEMAHIKTGPDNLFLYARITEIGSPSYFSSSRGTISTWPGTALDPNANFGPKRNFPCFGPFPSVRRAVTCRIYGVLYHGWYFESSGDYCRLKRSKRQ